MRIPDEKLAARQTRHHHIRHAELGFIGRRERHVRHRQALAVQGAQQGRGAVDVGIAFAPHALGRQLDDVRAAVGAVRIHAEAESETGMAAQHGLQFAHPCGGAEIARHERRYLIAQFRVHARTFFLVLLGMRHWVPAVAWFYRAPENTIMPAQNAATGATHTRSPEVSHGPANPSCRLPRWHPALRRLSGLG
ncbi:MAG: hypothetical protein IPH23_01990 [Gammaproteobacteria bacterium]|nr:hypothetical protein [Gammaproteobacteria bacterium]